MSEWSCIKCKHRDEPMYSFPCYICVDGDEYEPKEGGEDE